MCRFSAGLAAPGGARQTVAAMTLEEFIRHEVKLAQAGKLLNALSLRFVQLHLQLRRDRSEDAEYRMLRDTMRTRWRWHRATLEARLRSSAAIDAARPASATTASRRPPAS